MIKYLFAPIEETGTPTVAVGARVRIVAWAVSADGPRDEYGLIRDGAGDVVTIDDNVTVPPGTEGTVHHLDDTGTVFVKWDNGAGLGMLPGVDRWEQV